MLTPKPSPHPETKLSKGAFEVNKVLGFSHLYSFFIYTSVGAYDYPHLTD